MKIITSNPVFKSGETKSPSEMYYNATSLPGVDINKLTSQAKEYEASQEGAGNVWNKIKGVWEKAKESGAIDKAKDFIKDRNRPKSGQRPIPRPSTPPRKPQKQGMSTTTKVLIGVGIVAVVGFAIYSFRKK